jgi:CheY-like chemotaxis protein
VDDDAATLNVISQLLDHHGAVVRTASSAAEGLQKFKEFRPDELLCDVSMPVENGYSFIRKIRKLGSAYGGTVPAIAMTALACKADRDEAIAAGFQIHLTKPVDSERLTKALVDLTIS